MHSSYLRFYLELSKNLKSKNKKSIHLIEFNSNSIIINVKINKTKWKLYKQNSVYSSEGEPVIKKEKSIDTTYKLQVCFGTKYGLFFCRHILDNLILLCLTMLEVIQQNNNVGGSIFFFFECFIEYFVL